MKTATRQDLIKMGFSQYYADKIFKEYKALLIANKYSFYRNNKIKRIPVSVIEKVLNISWKDEY
ncbi:MULTISPECIES: DUF3173 family protein [unclassified Enterococcus]|uniref:DUF3173 family protein n=1 Tax=unclassified Enterococcus TaxID=2608891 RepID=UPI00190389AF|nr:MULTISPECIES: DUF3173 family protein [unclassified Enterococcus]MBK0036092.1 DUF3173 family protein [Enterococcus sp. S52]MBK0068750.1 DUF3173 family protein [Enterococcus sp. S53]MBK0139343.1 DUF3173 family protein [Enterococcus sp. S76]MBK0142978.1 DUF3173 family protein [Enterococcus sp. S77]